MSKIEEAHSILKEIGLPEAQQNEIAALTLLALCGIKESDSWRSAQRSSLTLTKGVMVYIDQNYGKHYAPNTRETFRRQVLHQFVQARLVDYNPDDPELPTNSPNAHYAISQEALDVIKTFNTDEWLERLEKFKKEVGELKEKYEGDRKLNLVPLTLPNGETVQLSPGAHNKLQAAVIMEFAPRFAKGCILLYVGDTANKDLHIDSEMLKELSVPIDEHGKLPDIVIYDPGKNWLYLIEVVTSHGPITPKRVIELGKMLENCNASRIYVSAFPDFGEFNRHTSELAWETEVWIAEHPEHMIHYNGDKFTGPR